MTRSRAVAETVGVDTAQYLAEGAIAATTRELTYGVDLGGDGVGMVSAEIGSGSYSADSVSLGDGFYRITATAVTDTGYRVTLQTVTELTDTSKFPG